MSVNQQQADELMNEQRVSMFEERADSDDRLRPLTQKGIWEDLAALTTTKDEGQPALRRALAPPTGQPSWITLSAEGYRNLMAQDPKHTEDGILGQLCTLRAFHDLVKHLLGYCNSLIRKVKELKKLADQKDKLLDRMQQVGFASVGNVGPSRQMRSEPTVASGEATEPQAGSARRRSARNTRSHPCCAEREHEQNGKEVG